MKIKAWLRPIATAKCTWPGENDHVRRMYQDGESLNWRTPFLSET